MKHKISYNWKLKNANFTKDKGNVFSCFACGGGSTMGYKLAGFDVIGMNEIDPKMGKAYIANHNPKYPFIEPIQTFRKRKDLPKELYNLDILDGSPPCSTFSIAGDREKVWGKKKKFKEGQAEQVLDTLFFEFIKLAKKLQPKIVVSENVKGIISGAATKYIGKIYRDFDKAGYYTFHYLLNSSSMGIPQERERVFFISIRKDLAKPFISKTGLFAMNLKIDMNFKQKPIPIEKFAEGYQKRETQNYLPHRFGDRLLNKRKPSPTITTKDRLFLDTETLLTEESLCKIGSFPTDYDFCGFQPIYLIGMSVPPLMMYNVADRVYEHILSKISE